jgi:hypothetical protein
MPQDKGPSTAVACERWWSVPWKQCDTEPDWLVFHEGECSQEPCAGHPFCHDHLISPTLADPARRGALTRIERMKVQP